MKGVISMGSIDIRIDKSDMGESVILLPQFSLGKISSETGIDEKRGKFITMTMSTAFVMKTMEDAVFRNLNYEDRDSTEEIKELQEEIRGYMQEYAKSYILGESGVMYTPIMRDANGNLKGFKKDIEVNIITE
jgi:hypothetical protein